MGTCGQITHGDLTGDFDFQVLTTLSFLAPRMLGAGEFGAEGGFAGVVLDGTAVVVLDVLRWLAWSDRAGHVRVFAVVLTEVGSTAAKLGGGLWCIHTTTRLLVLVLREGCTETIPLILGFDESCVQ